MRFIAFLLVILLLGVTVGAAAWQPSDDDRIYDEVKKRLALDRDIKGNAFEVDVKDGVVTIQGAVAKERFRGKAEKIVKKVKGVKGVVNKLVVKES